MKRSVLFGALVCIMPFFAQAQVTACPIITQYLTIGSRTAQVVTLKKYLAQEKVLTGVSNTNYFGPSTAAALKAWQKKKGIDATGATGPKTRAALKNCAQTMQQPVQPVPKTVPKTVTPAKRCIVGGCSGQLCVDAAQDALASTCEWKEEYACYKKGTCGTLPNGTCGWTDMPQINQCIAQVRGNVCIAPVCAAPPEGCWYENSTPCSCGTLRCVTNSSSCTFNGKTIADGASVDAYEVEGVDFGMSCESVKQKRVCDKGVLLGTYRFASCRTSGGGVVSTCLFNGADMQSGISVTAYKERIVPSNKNCEQETRTCNQGTLSGTYAFASCSKTLPEVTRTGFKEVVLGGQNIYSPDVVSHNGVRHLYFGGWLTAGQTHDAIYRSQCGNLGDTCTNTSKVLDPQPYGFDHLNDPSLVKMPGGYYIMYMTGLVQGLDAFTASNNKIYYSTSFVTDGVNWSTPREVINNGWLPSATIGKTGQVELYANETKVHGNVVRFKMGESGTTPAPYEPVVFSNGVFYLNPDVEYRQSIGLYQMFAERQGAKAIDYLTSTDGINFTLVAPDIATSTSTGVTYIRTPGQDAETGAWLYYAGTNEENATKNKLFFESWSVQ
jgi:eight-cysteine-cluster-containing protein